jgi:hypothetical protein
MMGKIPNSFCLWKHSMIDLFNFSNVSTEYICDYVGLFVTTELLMGVLVVKNLLVKTNVDKVQTSALILSVVYYTLCSFKNFQSAKYNDTDVMGGSDDALARMFGAISYGLHITYIVSNNKELTGDNRVSELSSKLCVFLAIWAPFINLDVVYSFLSLSQVLWVSLCIMNSTGYRSRLAMNERKALKLALFANVMFLLVYNWHMFIDPDSVFGYGLSNVVEAAPWIIYHSCHIPIPVVIV